MRPSTSNSVFRPTAGSPRCRGLAAPARGADLQFRSQLGQDRWILEAVFGPGHSGFFTDVGAGDGIEISNTYALEQHGWRGICIEADDDNFRDLERNRSVSCVQACVYSDTREVEFVVPDRNFQGEGRHFGGVHGHLDAYRPPGRRVRKRTRTLASILDECEAPSVIDYPSLDVEGAEFEVLRVFPFDRFEIGAITVEHNAYLGDDRLKRNLANLLLPAGFRRVRELDWEDWYLSAALGGDGDDSRRPVLARRLSSWFRRLRE